MHTEGLRTQDRHVVICLALLVALIVLPALLFPFPPLLDYPNHLARIWLIEGGVRIPPLNTFYFEDWSRVGSGLGIDLAAKIFGQLIPPFSLGLILLLFSMLLPPLGTIALNARLFGGLNAWQPLFLLFWCSETLIAGFLNFQIGLGVALLAAAADQKLERRGAWVLYGGRFAASVLLILIHPFALLFYSALIAGLAFGRDAHARNDLSTHLQRSVVAAASCLVPVIAFFIRVHGVPGTDGKLFTLVAFNNSLGVLQAMASPFSSYDLRVDLLFALPFAALVIYGLLKRRFSVHTGLLALAGFFAVCALFIPSRIGDTGWIDKRLPLMAVLTGLAAMRFVPRPKHSDLLLVAGAALVIFRTAWISLNWDAGAPMIETMRSVLAKVPPGSRVLAMQHKNDDREGFFRPLGRSTATMDEVFRHYPALMIPWRHAFTPMLFAQYREKPILVRPPNDRISNPAGGTLLSVHALLNPYFLNKRTQYVRKWRESFDYVLVLNADRLDTNGPFVPPQELQMVSNGGFAQLFRIRKGLQN